MLSTEFSNLRREYDALMQVKSELHATQLELERMKQEKDFHHEQHLILRRDLLQQLNRDFENDQLKRDKHHLENDLRAFKEKNIILEKQIEEILVFAQKPKDSEEGGREFFFAKKIVKLEEDLESLTKERDQLQFDNNMFKEGFKELKAAEEEKNRHATHDMLMNDTTTDSANPQSMLEQLRALKRRNDMLAKENSLIRKELDSTLQRREANAENFNPDHYRMQDLQQENAALRLKVDKLQKNLVEHVHADLKAGGGVPKEEVER